MTPAPKPDGPKPPRVRHRRSLGLPAPHQTHRTASEADDGWQGTGEAGRNRVPGHLGLSIEYVPISLPKPGPRNTRTHSKGQLRQIEASIETFGFVNPILIDEFDQIIAGHGRRDAAERAGLEFVPTIRLSHLSEHEKRALAIADNKLPENAGWNEELLAQELKILSEVDVDFNVTVTGFSQAEIDLKIEGLGPADDPAADELPDAEADDAVVVRRGDLFRLDRHLLLCGDATSANDFATLMQGQKAQMVITDPPYNLLIKGHVSGLGRTKHQDFVQASGEMSPECFTTFLRQSCANLAALSIDGSIHFLFMDWRHMGELLEAGRSIFTEFKQLCIWAKTNAGMGTFYRSQHELIFVFKNGTAQHINNFELGQHGRHRSNIWSYPGVNALGPDRMTELAMHPTVKPAAMIADAILDCSARQGIVLDPFVGSGTTIIAAEKTGRRAYTMDLDPMYVQTAIRRWQAYSGEPAVHTALGLSFDELCERRRDSGATDRDAGS